VNVTTVRVTEENIAKGDACNSRRCPIALAVLDALADQGAIVAVVSVDSYDVMVALHEKDDTGLSRRYRADLDYQGHRFVETFDEPLDSDKRDPAVIVPFEMELTWRELNR
jgi:hypothetical protein